MPRESHNDGRCQRWCTDDDRIDYQRHKEVADSLGTLLDSLAPVECCCSLLDWPTCHASRWRLHMEQVRYTIESR
jgi:hypothetical protein